MDKQNKLKLILGLILLIASPFILTRPALNSLFDFSKTGQIGDTIGGITSPIINLLGAYLVYISFREQTNANKVQFDALKKNQEFLQKQQAETTFFNLLNNYRTLSHSITISETQGSEGLRKAYQDYKKGLDSYKDQLNSHIFRSFNKTFFNPHELYNSNNNEGLKTLMNSLIHIINYIKTNINNEVFYHQTLFNNLTLEEKFILGMVIENSLSEEKIENTTFVYSSEFKKNSNYINLYTSGYFPYLYLNEYVPISEFDTNNITNNSLLKKQLEFQIIRKDLKYNQTELEIDKVEFHFQSDKMNNWVILGLNNISKKFDNSITISIFNEFASHILPDYKNSLSYNIERLEYSCQLRYFFHYNQEIYIVEHSFKLLIQRSKNSDNEKYLIRKQ